MKNILPIFLGIVVALGLLAIGDPISHPKNMVGTWDTDGEAHWELKPFGICTNSYRNYPGRWFVKDGHVYMSALFAYEEAEIISDTEWIMHEKDLFGNPEFDKTWKKIEESSESQEESLDTGKNDVTTDSTKKELAISPKEKIENTTELPHTIVSDSTTEIDNAKSEDTNTLETIENIDVENEVSTIREKYNDIVKNIQSDSYSTIPVDKDVTGYVSNDIEAIYVNKGYKGNEYSRKYYFSNGKLIFAFFEAEDAHRLYFKDDRLFRWRYSESASDPQHSVNHDGDHVDDYDRLEEIALAEAYSLSSIIC